MSSPEFLKMYLEDTDEQLAQLGRTLNAWEEDRTNPAHPTEALRLIHAMEGAAGSMGFENLRAATQWFDRQLVRMREDATLDVPLVAYAGFLSDCNARLRRGETLAASDELVEEMKQAARDR